MKTASYRRTLLASAVALGMIGVSQNAAAVAIDQFGPASFFAQIGPANTPSPLAPQTVAGGIGGWRIISGTSSGNTTQLEINTTAPGRYSHSQSSGVTGTSQIVWGGNTGSGFSATDFTDGQLANAIRVHINDTDENVQGNTLAIQLSDLGGHSATQTYQMSARPAAVFYVDFLLSGFSGVNPEQVTRVQMNLNGSQDDDWDIDIQSIVTACSGNTNTPVGSVTPNPGVCEPPVVEPPEVQHPKTVPAMTPLGLLGLGAGLVGIAGFFARRRKK